MDIGQQWLFLSREDPGHDYPRLSLHAASNDSEVFLFPQMLNPPLILVQFSLVLAPF